MEQAPELIENGLKALAEGEYALYTEAVEVFHAKGILFALREGFQCRRCGHQRTGNVSELLRLSEQRRGGPAAAWDHERHPQIMCGVREDRRWKCQLRNRGQHRWVRKSGRRDDRPRAGLIGETGLFREVVRTSHRDRGSLRGGRFGTSLSQMIPTLCSIRRP